MKNNKTLNKLPLSYNLQFFAEGGEENNASGSHDQTKDGQQQNQNQGQEEKKFTQTEVAAMMAREKNEGKSAALKALGFSSEKDAKDAVKLLNALMDSQKTDAEKAQGEIQKAVTAQQEAELRAKKAEDKLTMIQEGVKADSVDDVLAIAQLKVSKDNDLSKVLKEMKKDQRYSAFFTDGGAGGNSGNDKPGSESNRGNSSSGTGNSFGGNSASGGSGGSGAGNYGSNLAQRLMQSNANSNKTSCFE